MLIALDVIMGLGVIYVIASFAMVYFTATGTGWQRLLAAGQQSATILWQRAVIALAGLSAVLVDVAGYLGVPSIDNAIQAVLKPQYVGLFTILVAVVSEIARKRTL